MLYHNSDGNQMVVYYVQMTNLGTGIKQKISGLTFRNLTDEDKQPMEGFTFEKWQKNRKISRVELQKYAAIILLTV